jgi:hypothetical protein
MLLVSIPALAQTPLGSEFQVNVYTTGDHSTPAVAAAEIGDFVVVWRHRYFLSDDIRMRRFASDGSPLGAESVILSADFAVDKSPAVASAPDGRFVVVWQGYGYGPTAITGQPFASDGSPLGSGFSVVGQGYDYNTAPGVGMDDDGGFVVAWSLNGDISAQRFDAVGTALGSRLSVNSYATGQQGDPSVAVEADGDFIVVWDRDQLNAGSNIPIVARRYASNGSPIGAEFQVSANALWPQKPVVARDARGDFVVAWSDYFGGENGYFGIRGRQITADGAVQGTDFTISTEHEYASDPSVSAGGGGQFLVAWDSRNEVRGRVILADGTAVDDVFQVNSYATGAQTLPAVAGANNQFVAVWQSGGSSGTDPDLSIQAQRLASDAVVFVDGFESGNTAAWSSIVGGP